MRNSSFLLFLSLLLCVVAVCTAESSSDKLNFPELHNEISKSTLANKPQVDVSRAVLHREVAEGKSENLADMDSSNSENEPLVYATALDLETNWSSNYETLHAISSGTGIAFDAMAVVDENNQPIPELWAIRARAYINSTIVEDNFRPLRVGFLHVGDEEVTLEVVREGNVSGVRLPTIMPPADNPENFISDNLKIIIGCAVGIGVPAVIGAVVLLCYLCNCCCWRAHPDDYHGLGDVALMDMDKEVTLLSAPDPMKERRSTSAV